MHIGIVGADERKWGNNMMWSKAMDYIVHILKNPRDILVSGHSPKGGIDIWAEGRADDIGMEKLIFPPKKFQWEPDGYKERNIKIAENSDIIFVINPDGVWSGGTWTGKYAESIGKDVLYINVKP